MFRMQHEPRCPVLGAREPRQGDYGVLLQVLSTVERSQVPIGTGTAAAAAGAEVVHEKETERQERLQEREREPACDRNRDEGKGGEGENDRLRQHEEFVAQVARLEEETKAVDIQKRQRRHECAIPPLLLLLLSLRGELEIGIDTIAATATAVAGTAATAITVAAFVSSVRQRNGEAREILLQGDF